VQKTAIIITTKPAELYGLIHACRVRAGRFALPQPYLILRQRTAGFLRERNALWNLIRLVFRRRDDLVSILRKQQPLGNELICSRS
jgi:hypothetical protein